MREGISQVKKNELVFQRFFLPYLEYSLGNAGVQNWGGKASEGKDMRVLVLLWVLWCVVLRNKASSSCKPPPLAWSFAQSSPTLTLEKSLLLLGTLPPPYERRRSYLIEDMGTNWETAPVDRHLGKLQRSLRLTASALVTSAETRTAQMSLHWSVMWIITKGNGCQAYWVMEWLLFI